MTYIKYILMLTGFLCFPVHAEEAFKIRATGERMNVTIAKTYTESDYLCPIESKSRINGLAITGRIHREGNDYLVRVILKTTDGKEFCVFESYAGLNHASDFSFTDFCEETALLNDITPDTLSVIVRNANVRLESLSVSLSGGIKQQDNVFFNDCRQIRKEQVQTKTAGINEYNKTYGRLWRAGVTELSLKSYTERKRILGMHDDSLTGGLEYYFSGIFEFDGDFDANLSNVSLQCQESPFPDSFSWCNMHGKNWMTSIKTQGEAGYCFHFAVIGCVEAMANLYFNQKIDLDLSEEELASCSGMSFNPYYGTTSGEMYKPFEYFRNHGVCDELAYPYNPSPSGVVCNSGEVNPNELVNIDGYDSVVNTEDSVKYALINRGPLVTGIHKTGWINHAMVLVGWEKLHVGQTVYFYINENGQADGHHVVREDDPHIGMTVYIFKNSGGLGDPNSNDGYFYYIPSSWGATANPTYYCKLPITTMAYTNADIACEDADGDGLYFWGLGPKPMNSPSWVPDTPDGNDSDINYGVMDNYGNLDILPAGITIKTDTTYSSAQSDSRRYGIVSGGTLRVTGSIIMTGNAGIRVCEGGTLIVDGGTIQNADIQIVPGSTLVIRNGGTINLANGKSLNIPKGVVAEIDEGAIL